MQQYEDITSIVEKIPVEGLVGGILKLGLLGIYAYGGPTEAATNLLDVAATHKDVLKAMYSGAKLGGDYIKKGHMESIFEYFRTQAQDRLTNLVTEVLKSVKDDHDVEERLLKDLRESLETVDIDKDKIVFGRIFKKDSKGRLLGLLPDIIKQPEFHEHRYKFMTPSASVSGKTQIIVDPVWFFVFSLGYVMSFLGSSANTHYFAIPDIDTIITESPETTRNIISSLRALEYGIAHALSISCSFYAAKELFELAVAYNLVTSGAEISRIIPVEVYVISRVGNAYIVKEIFDLDVYDVYNYILNVSRKVDNVNFIGILIRRACNELEGTKEDLGIVVLPFLRSLYAAIKGRDPRVLLDALYRLQRIELYKFQDAKKKYTVLLSSRQVHALIEALMEGKA